VSPREATRVSTHIDVQGGACDNKDVTERPLTRRDVEAIRNAYSGRGSEANDIIVCLCDALLERMPAETTAT